MDSELRELLLAWHAEDARVLPWRATRDPYAVLVSEVMLQQTQAARVVPRYSAFLQRFPNVAVLADATPRDVLVQWQGLGYNRRALALQVAANVVMQRHGGLLPDDLEALRALPGVGDYTARAILAFAFDRVVAPVDVNVARVLARAVAGTPLSRAQAQLVADRMVPDGASAAWTSALMDLGAAACAARSPRCHDCPITSVCAWRRAGGAQQVADPALATAARSRPQGQFAGSDRYHRGRLVDALRLAPVAEAYLAAAAGLSDAGRLPGLAAGLVADGLAEWHGGGLRLPADAVG